MVIVDEYSVISCAMLYWMDQRMREIWPDCADIPFGGRDIIFVGGPWPIESGSASSSIDSPCMHLITTIRNVVVSCGFQLKTYIILYLRIVVKRSGMVCCTWTFAKNGAYTRGTSVFFNTRHASTSTISSKTTYIAYMNADVDRANEEMLRSQSEQL